MGGVGVGGWEGLSSSCYFVFIWLAEKLILIDVRFRDISFMYTVYDCNNSCYYCQGKYLRWLCLFVCFWSFANCTHVI
jgi:hypothetical protein